jgi:hypothetical protein
MRSIGSATSAIRPPPTETIPERVDDVQEGSDRSPRGKKGKGKERVVYSAASAAAAANASRSPSTGSPASITSTSFTKPPPTDELNTRDTEHVASFASHNTPARFGKSSISSLNGNDERERYPTPPLSTSRLRDSEYDDRIDRRERLDYMNGSIAGAEPDHYEPPYGRPYYDRPNLTRLGSFTRPSPILRDDHERRDG